MERGYAAVKLRDIAEALEMRKAFTGPKDQPFWLTIPSSSQTFPTTSSIAGIKTRWNPNRANSTAIREHSTEREPENTPKRVSSGP